MSSGDDHEPIQPANPTGPDPADRLAAKLRLLPAAPGVYLHKDRQGKILYVGKAKRLNARVRSYFQEGEDRDPKTVALVRHIADFDYIATDTETDALVLENQLIKEYKPRYNVRLKDDKQYPYLRIGLEEPYPRLSVVRRLGRDGARYFGPYTDVRAMRETLKVAAGLFQVRTCSLDLPDRTVDRPCLDHQIGRCTAPCVDLVGREDYREQVRQLVAFLEGRDRTVIAELTERMQALATAREFEAAAALRDRLRKLATTVAEGRSLAGFSSEADVCGLVRDGEDACGVVLRVRGGRILTTHHFLMSDRWEQRLDAFLAQLLREYYPRAGDIPPLVLLSHDLEDRASWEEWLGRLRGARVALEIPRRGDRRDAVELAQRNAAFKLGERTLQATLRAGRAVDPGDVALQEALGLHKVPETIECFDVSNFQGKETVASLVFFKGGEPLKSRYRRFRVRTVVGPDDFASLEEVLDRYYGKLAASAQRPADLVMVDGGVGQLGRARAVLARHGFADTDLIGLAKRDETIVRETGELRLPRRSPALKLLQRVRDEAHRFAITYHRLLRDQRTTASELDLIPGIGRVKKLSLLYHFGSVAAIREATADELASVRGLGPRDAVNILAFFAERRQRGGDG
ncbi:MAG TPA: excinuclease ABC subunit UvrC [Candidatus Krumholzibacteria bacterium]|nr:excinuclease ABC subunit UvrC [Candidatus Krumholzibacteria bacterium]HPD71577.1 excinuclease ABC subunit UvrC [Candidatus Krumholzibacteria bacterium]HRY41490.1 excinuclease ABC subunit UvrC [Candidatus Krumholzibacteria bacterium]